jgi:sugar phosphate isomerase/epimerase
MVKFSASSLSFTGPSVNQMRRLSKEIGIEIFWEWGSKRYWEHMLDAAMPGRSGGFSIHSPFCHMDVSHPCDDKKLFDELMQPFDLYHKYHADFYVVHANGRMDDFEPDPGIEDDRRKLAMDRLAHFDALCSREGVQMAVENLGFNNGERCLFSH